MSPRAVQISIPTWDQATIDSLADRVERCGRGIAELGVRGATSMQRAIDLAAALRAAGRALAFVEEDDRDARVVVFERLDDLERESQRLLTLWQDDDATKQYDADLRELARRAFDDERTRVRPRIVPPARALARRARG